MKDKAQFLDKLNDLVNAIRKKGNQVTTFEVKEYFSDTELTEEQIELVYDYLLSQKVVVKGYIKMDEQEVENEPEFTEEEERYLEEFSRQLEVIGEVTEEEKENLLSQAVQGDKSAKSRIIEIYLKEVLVIAKEMHDGQVFLGDLIEEGTIGLVSATETLKDVETAHDTLLSYIRRDIQMEIERQQELKERDKQMVGKVQMLDEAITALTEELGRKVTLEELAVYMGMTEDEVVDILKLAGEDAEE